MYKFTSFSLYFSFFLSVSGFFHVYFFSINFFLKFSSDYWGGKKGFCPPILIIGGRVPGLPPRVYTYDGTMVSMPWQDGQYAIIARWSLVSMSWQNNQKVTRQTNCHREMQSLHYVMARQT